MNYKEARVYLDEVSKYGSVLGLESMRELLRRLGDPQNELKFIHISGTNGKGSVLAYLSTILSGAGYRTGRYISPTLFSYRERIQVDGEYIEKESLACHVTAIAAAAEDMQKAGLPSPTVFEIETALAFLYFKEKRCDIVTLEVGCGGLLDATNVITTTLMEVIASISMDHTDLLGDTLAKIAAQKAGIIKPDTMVVSAQQKSEAAQVIEDTCKEQHCTLQMVDESKISNVHYGAEGQTFSYKEWENVAISLAGSYQIKNAALALEGVEALRKLGYALSDQQVREGLLHTAWRGRFTTLRRDPTVIIDGAHNPAAALELKESLERYFPGKTLYFVMGMFKDKDYAQVIDLTAPLARHIITVETPGNPRAMPARELAEAVGKVNPSVEWADSVAHGVEKALAMAGKEDAVIVFGSLSFLGEAADAVNEK
ncbi:MAG TPA: bifunctional folylpolyglutamate synthase/dihydrofolate synthase [Oscillibacter sp.]|jgi:dihydrofolate synthase/folylpolyglutamate synthase|nr:bifunctional folylpolyglutamate synthase/dihydrofolate synthase [Oscillibacter sp.]